METENCKAINVFTKHILGEKVRVLMTDERLIEGFLSCLDRNMNLIIESAIEYHNTSLKQAETPVISGGDLVVTKSIGMTMIPGAHVVKILCLNNL